MELAAPIQERNL